MQKATHRLHLAKLPFSKIEKQTKHIESRLYDEKRRKLQLGDIIEFHNDNGETLHRIISGLLIYPSFAELMHDRAAQDFGWNVPEKAIAEIEQFYTKEEQQHWGVVGIKLSSII